MEVELEWRNCKLPEIWFYHLTQSRLFDALPGLLEKGLARGWRAVIQTSSETHMKALDDHLWSFRDEAFIPHGAEGSGLNAEDNPVWITIEEDNPNKANIRFLVDGAATENLEGYERIVRMFDGHDPEALAAARECWKKEKAAGYAVSYWQQSEEGGWQKKA